MPPASSLEPSTAGPNWIHHAHLTLTGLLLLGLAGLVGLALTGRMHFNPQSSAPAIAPEGESKGATAKGDAVKEGRYRIEPIDDARRLLELAGPPGFFGQSMLQAWVYRYTGGYLECRLETDVDGKTAVGGPLPSDWKSLLPRDERLSLNEASTLRKEGYIVLTALQSVLPIDQALAPYSVHLGGLFVSGPAGPLHQLVTTHLEARAHRPFRLFVTAAPPKDVAGPAFHVWDELPMLIRYPLIRTAGLKETQRIGQGKDLAAGMDITLLEQQRGLSTLRLVARFLTDETAIKLASGR